MLKQKDNEVREKAIIMVGRKEKTVASHHSVFISLERDSDLITKPP